MTLACGGAYDRLPQTRPRPGSQLRHPDCSSGVDRNGPDHLGVGLVLLLAITVQGGWRNRGVARHAGRARLARVGCLYAWPVLYANVADFDPAAGGARRTVRTGATSAISGLPFMWLGYGLASGIWLV